GGRRRAGAPSRALLREARDPAGHAGDSTVAHPLASAIFRAQSISRDDGVMARTSRFSAETRESTVAPGRPASAATLALAGVLVLATVLRLLVWANHRGAPWFEEDVPLVWAWRLWGFPGGRFDLNPHSALWPHLSVYVYFVVQAVQYGLGRLTGMFAGPADFRAAVLLDPPLLRRRRGPAASGLRPGTPGATAPPPPAAAG